MQSESGESSAPATDPNTRPVIQPKGSATASDIMGRAGVPRERAGSRSCINLYVLVHKRH